MPWSCAAAAAAARRARADRVVELHEVETLGAQDCFELVWALDGVVRDAGIADRAVALPGAQRRQVRAPVDAGCGSASDRCGRLQRAQRALHLRDARRRARGPHLGREEGRLCACRAAVTRSPTHALGVAVHRRAVDDPAAGLERTAAPRRAARARRAGADVEGLPGAAADDRQPPRRVEGILRVCMRGPVCAAAGAATSAAPARWRKAERERVMASTRPGNRERHRSRRLDGHSL